MSCQQSTRKPLKSVMPPKGRKKQAGKGKTTDKNAQKISEELGTDEQLSRPFKKRRNVFLDDEAVESGSIPSNSKKSSSKRTPSKTNTRRKQDANDSSTIASPKKPRGRGRRKQAPVEPEPPPPVLEESVLSNPSSPGLGSNEQNELNETVNQVVREVGFAKL